MYIHDPDMTLNFDLKVKFIEVLTCFRVLPMSSVCFDISIPYLAYTGMSTSIRECVAFIHDPDMMLTFDLKVNFIGFLKWLCVWATAFFVD